LEIIGPDTKQQEFTSPRLFGIDNLSTPKLVTWAAKSADLDQLSANAATQGLQLGNVSPGRRETPQGALLEWRFTNPRMVIDDGIVPFFIDWGQTQHPARMAREQGVSLVDLRAEHPEADRVQQDLRRLSLDVPVTVGPTPALIAVIRGTKGMIELR
jgi:hypothetical protein